MASVPEEPRSSGRSAQSTLLAVRVGRLGDLVMVTPALRAMRQAFPDSEIHFLTSRQGQLVLKADAGLVDRFLVYDRGLVRGLATRRHIKSHFAAASYEQAFVFESDPRYMDLMGSSADTVHELQRSSSAAHYSRRCVDLVMQATGVSDPGWARLSVTPDGSRKAAELMSRIGVRESTLVIGLHPTSWLASRPDRFLHGSTLNHRQWPAAHFARLAEAITGWAHSRGVEVRVTVDVLPGERSLARKISDLSDGKVTVLSEPPDFERYKAVLARLDLLVSINTGPMHVAAAVGTPIVALSSRNDPAECGPYAPPEQFVALRAEDTDSPELGMAAIDPSRVFEECLRFLRLRG